MAPGSGKEEKKSGGGEVGFRFKPGEAEVVEYYLLPRLQGRPPVPNDAVVVENVYKYEPERLINERCNGGGDEDVWYFLSPRNRKYPYGNRPSRATADSAGRWKASTGKTEAKQTVCYGGVKFCVTSLVYFKGPVKEEEKTKWLMREFTIPQFENKVDKSGAAGSVASSSDKLDQFVLCKIYTSPKKGVDNGEKDNVGCDADGWAEACAIFNLEPEAAESSSQGAAAGDVRSRKQAGKRPVQAAAEAEPPSKRPCLPPPPSSLVHGSSDGGQPPMPPQAMGNRHVPMQQLPLMYDFPPAAAHSGHQPHPPMYRGHAPVQQGFRVHNNQAQMRRLPMQDNCMPPPMNNVQPQPVQRRPIHRCQAPVHNNSCQPLPVHGGQTPMHQIQWLPMRNAQSPVHQLQLPVMYDGELPEWTLEIDNLGLPMQHLPLPVMMSNYQEEAQMQLPPMMNNYQEEAQMQLPPMMNNDQPAMMHGGEVQPPMINNDQPHPVMMRGGKAQAPIQQLPVTNNDQPQPAVMQRGEVQAPMPPVVSEEQKPSQDQCTNAEG